MRYVDRLVFVNRLESWLMRPFTKTNDLELTYVKTIIKETQVLHSEDLSQKDFDDTVKRIEILFEDNKLKYGYVERMQIKKAIKNMKSSVLNRMISDAVVPATTKLVDVVRPVVSKTYNDKLLPAAEKTKNFFKSFLPKKIEVVEKKNTDGNNSITD